VTQEEITIFLKEHDIITATTDTQEILFGVNLC